MRPLSWFGVVSYNSPLRAACLRVFNRYNLGAAQAGVATTITVF